jgi:hypothetical protein
VDGIIDGGDEILQHDRTVDGDRHDVCPGAVSIESMRSGDREERLLHDRWREQCGDAAEQIPPFQRVQGACWFVVFFLCISLLYGKESHGDN